MNQNLNHRYPTRALTINSGDQLLQKRTRSTLSKPDGKNTVLNESHQSSSKKPRTKDQLDLENQHLFQMQYAEQMNPNANDKFHRANKKTNPRMVNAQMMTPMNPRQGKQLFKDAQPHFMASPSPMWQQNQFMHPAPQLMNMNPFGMQMPMMQAMPQMQQMPQMYPQMASDPQAQIENLQRQVMLLQQSQSIQMQQMPQMYNQFQTPMMNMGQPGMYPPNMIPQQVQIDQESQDEVSKQKESAKSTKKSKSPSARQSPAKRQSQSPDTKSYAKPGSVKAKKGQAANAHKKAEEPVAAQIKNTRSVKIQEKSKIAPKSVAQKKSPVKIEDKKTPTKILKSQLEKPSSNKSSPSKSKMSSVASIQEDEQIVSNKRATRNLSKAVNEKKTVQKEQIKNSGNITPTKNFDTLPKRTLRSSQTYKAEVGSKKVKKISPVRTSPRKTVAKHTRANYYHPDTTPVRQTRLRSRVDHSKPKQSPSKAMSENAIVEKSNISSTQEHTNILKSLQKDINTAKDDLHKRGQTQAAKSHSRSSEKKKEENRPPTQDEIMLFGESSFQNNVKESSLRENPLLNSKKKFEAQTEIVVGKSIDNFGQDQQVFTDEEEDQEMKEQLIKEKQFLEKRDQLKQLEENLIPQDKLKDMSQLFGMPEEEVIEIAEKQKTQIQKIKDEQKLFGQSFEENPVEVVKEFSQTKSLSLNEAQPVKVEEPVTHQKQSDENMLFGEQPVEEEQIVSIQPAQEPQVSEKIQDKSIEVSNTDEALLFGSQQKQTLMSAMQEETPQENIQNDSFDIKVQQNSPCDSKPVSADTVSAVNNKINSTQQSEYVKKQEELDRQIAEIKRQIALQTEKAKTIEQDIIQPETAKATLFTEEAPVEPAADEDHEMIEDSQQVEVEQPSFQKAEDKEMENVQEQEISEDEIQEALQESIQVIESQPVLHRNCQDKLRLTDKFRLLYDFQNSLDVAMNMVLIKNQSTSFTNLKNIIQLQTKRQFNLSHFQQLIKLEPHFFHHKWEMKMGKQELMIIHPANVDAIAQSKWNQGEIVQPSSQVFQGRISSSTILLRQKIIKNDLIKFMAHDLERNYADSNFNAYEQDQWPSFFKFDDVEDIELAQLKEQPKTAKKQTVDEFLQVQGADNIQKQVKQALDLSNQRNLQQQPAAVQIQAPVPQRQENDISQLSPSSSSSERDSSEEAQNRLNKNNATGISQNVLDAIELKQRLEQKQKETHENIVVKQNTQMKIEQLSKLAERIRSIFDHQAGSTMFLARLVDNMVNSDQSGKFVSKEHLKDQIIELTKACPEWISLVKNMQGMLIKLHQHMNLQSYHLKQNIKDYLVSRAQGDIYQPVPSNQRSTKSLPPPSQKQAPVSQGIQIYNKPQSGFQPYPRQQPGSHSQDQRSGLHKNMQISHLSSSNEQNPQLSSRKNSGAGPQIQNNMHQIRQTTSNYNQYMHQQQQQMNQNKIINMNHQQKNTQPLQQAVNNSVGISSSSGTFLSGPAAHDGGEASLGNDQHMPSKYLSPSLKQNHGGKQSSGYRGEGLSGIGIQFGNDMYQGMQSNSHSRVSSYGHSGYPQGNQQYTEQNQQQNFYRNQQPKY